MSQPPTVTTKLTSATVSWKAWGTSSEDTGDGPVIAYKVYVSPASPPAWTEAGDVPVPSQPRDAYSFLVEPLRASAYYNFSVAAVRDGNGGQGPRSPQVSVFTQPSDESARRLQTLLKHLVNLSLPVSCRLDLPNPPTDCSLPISTLDDNYRTAQLILSIGK